MSNVILSEVSFSGMNTSNDHLEESWNEYRDKLLVFIRIRVGSHEDAEDILANIFLKLAKQSEQARIPNKLPNWLYRTTANAIIDYYRVKKPHDTLPDDLKEERPDLPAISTLSDCIVPIIGELPDNYKLPILRSEIEGKTHRQVADELNLSLSAVKSRILRGRKKLKELMAKRCSFYFDESGQLLDYKEKSSD